MIVAYCRGCGGWTMWHAEAESSTAKSWADACREQGDRVEVLPDDEDAGKASAACPSSPSKGRCK
jgi:hypothetical protein